MSHRHLVLAYVATWVIQLSYCGLLTAKWMRLRRTAAQYPTYGDVGE